MQDEKRDLLKKFKLVVEDLLDNYEKYTAEEQAQVKEIFQKAAGLNTLLDKYDVAPKADWQEFFTTYGKYFGKVDY